MGVAHRKDMQNLRHSEKRILIGQRKPAGVGYLNCRTNEHYYILMILAS